MTRQLQQYDYSYLICLPTTYRCTLLNSFRYTTNTRAPIDAAIAHVPGKVNQRVLVVLHLKAPPVLMERFEKILPTTTRDMLVLSLVRLNPGHGHKLPLQRPHRKHLSRECYNVRAGQTFTRNDLCQPTRSSRH